MSKIIDEVREISSQKKAEKQKNSEQNYPQLIEEIKRAAGRGETRCEFGESKIDQYSKKLLEADGFSVYATTKTVKPDYKSLAQYLPENDSIWVVSW